MKSILKKSGGGPFSQQEIKGYQPLLTPVSVVGILLIVAIIFISIGLVLLDASDMNVFQKVRYDNVEACEVTQSETYSDFPKTCNITLTIEDDMDAPIYFYYELDNFYQNHRLYISSKSDDQLRGTGISSSALSDCDEIKSYNSSYISPCGMIARSMFSDRFKMFVNGADLCTNCINYGSDDISDWHDHWADWKEEPNWSGTGIAWSSDLDQKFSSKYEYGGNATKLSQKGLIKLGQYQDDVSGLKLPSIVDEDFVVWMRIAALTSFRKLHRIIRDLDLKQGDIITITILNWFPVTEFDGKKWVALGTTTWAGLENYDLAWALIIMSVVCTILAVIFTALLHMNCPKRKLAQVDIFAWHNKPLDEAFITLPAERE